MTPCHSRACASVFLLAFTLSTLHADVTLRYRTEVNLNSALAAMGTALATQGADPTAPRETVLRYKGNRGFSSSTAFNAITDFTTKEITLLDAAGRRYAKLSQDQFIDAVAGALPQQPAAARAAMAAAKVNVSFARLTGRTAVIQGVEAEEREIVVTIQGPPVPNASASVAVKLVMQFWTVKAGEVMRVPAIRELAAYSAWASATMNPVATIDKMMKQMPGLSEAFAPVMKEMSTVLPVMRLHMEMFVPGLASLLQQQAPAGGNPFGAGFDPNAPLMQMNQEVAEISSATIPDSFFQVPEGYREAPAAEMVRGTLGMKPAESAGAIAPAFEISDPNAPQDAAGLVRLGRLAHEKGRQAEGDAYYRKALEFGDNADTAPALMGLALGSIVKDRAAALSYLDRALRADVSGPTAGPALSWMAYAHESDDPQRAASLYEQALNLEPADSPTRALTLELLARFTTAQAGLGDDAGRAKALTEEAQRIRAQHVASLSKPRQVGGQEQRIGGGVAPPKLAAKVEPVYTQVARLLKISGAVVLTVVVDVDGSARDIRLVRGLGFGLDEAAVNAVSQWRFEPGARAGAVVPVMATIEVNFRLL